MRRRRVAESCSGQLVEKKVESGDAAVAGDEEISSGVRRRRAGAARYPFDAAAIAQFLGLGYGLILKVGVSRFDRAGDAVDFVAASKGAFTRVVEHAILVPELVEGDAAARWVVFPEDIGKIADEQGRYAVGHDLSPSVLRNEYKFPGGLACFKELVNLGRFAQRIFRDFELELAFANQLEERRERLGHVVKAAFEIETTES
jgi:hypothetical protein